MKISNYVQNWVNTSLLVKGMGELIDHATDEQKVLLPPAHHQHASSSLHPQLFLPQTGCVELFHLVREHHDSSRRSHIIAETFDCIAPIAGLGNLISNTTMNKLNDSQSTPTATKGNYRQSSEKPSSRNSLWNEMREILGCWLRLSTQGLEVHGGFLLLLLVKLSGE